MRFKNNYKGVIALSNSKYNLYLNAESPGIDKEKFTKSQRNWNLLMNNLPSLFERKMSVDQIAQNYKLPYSQVLNYCGRWQKKNLIKKY